MGESFEVLDGGSQQAPPVHTKEAEGQEKKGMSYYETSEEAFLPN